MGETSPVAKYTAEFIGTFVLVFTIGCNVITGQGVWAGVSIASALTVMIYALANSSGANFNPAVSVALGITGNMEWPEVAMYCLTQVVAGISAGACYFAMFGESFNLQPINGHNMYQAGLAELIYTFMLVFVVLNVAASKWQELHQNQFYGIAIGFVIVAGAYSGGSVSMGCFNPAVAFGIDVASARDYGMKYSIVYTAFELLGAALAAGCYSVCRGEQNKCSSKEDIENFEVDIKGKLLSEFLGTYILVVTVGLNVLSGSPAGAFSIAAALMCMIFALGTVSGAHFNPAVTLAIICRGKCEAKDGMMYMVVQIAGGIGAAFTYSYLMNGATFALKPAAYGWSLVVLAELVFTFVLAFVVLSVATVKNELSEYFGFAIGMCVTVGGFAIGKVSGGSLNPAVSFGISTSHIISGGGFWPCLIYSAVELLAGAAAAGVFHLTHPSECSEAKLP